MSRELFGESVWVSEDPGRGLCVDAEHFDRRYHARSVDNYLVPREWTEDQVRHLLRQIFPLSRHINTYSRLELDDAACAARLQAALDNGRFPQMLSDDVPCNTRPFVRLPPVQSLATDDAYHCARNSRDIALLMRLVIEHPDPAVRGTARARLGRLRPGDEGLPQVKDEAPDSWIPWHHEPPVSVTNPLGRHRWLREAGVADALFDVRGTPEYRWMEGLRSRPIRQRHEQEAGLDALAESGLPPVIQ